MSEDINATVLAALGDIQRQLGKMDSLGEDVRDIRDKVQKIEDKVDDLTKQQEEDHNKIFGPDGLAEQVEYHEKISKSVVGTISKVVSSPAIVVILTLGFNFLFGPIETRSIENKEKRTTMPKVERIFALDDRSKELLWQYIEEYLNRRSQRGSM